MSKEHRGILQMLMCATLWSIAGIFMKFLPWHGLAVASIRSLFAGITIVVYMYMKHFRFCINPRTLLAGFFAGSTFVLFSLANKLTTAANAIVLQFTCPVFVVLFSALLYHKRIRSADALVVLIVLIGIALFFFDQLSPAGMLGNLVAIAAGMVMSGMYITIGDIEGEERFSAVLIGQLFAFAVGLPVVFVTRPLFNAITVSCIVILGVFQLGLAYILYVKSAETCPPLACCLLGAVEPLLNPVWVLIFNGERPGPFALVGGLIVITSVTLWCMYGRERKTEKDGMID